MHVTESEANGRLRIVSEESAEFAKTMNDTWAEVKTPEVVIGSDINVKVLETIVSVKIEPLESALYQIALQVDMRGGSHGCLL